MPGTPLRGETKPALVESGLGLGVAAGRSGGLVLGLAGELAVRVQAAAGVRVLAVGLVARPVQCGEAAVQYPDGAAEVVGANPVQGIGRAGQSIILCPRIESDKPPNIASNGNHRKIVRPNAIPTW